MQNKLKQQQSQIHPFSNSLHRGMGNRERAICFEVADKSSCTIDGRKNNNWEIEKSKN